MLLYGRAERKMQVIRLIRPAKNAVDVAALRQGRLERRNTPNKLKFVGWGAEDVMLPRIKPAPKIPMKNIYPRERRATARRCVC